VRSIEVRLGARSNRTTSPSSSRSTTDERHRTPARCPHCGKAVGAPTPPALAAALPVPALQGRAAVRRAHQSPGRGGIRVLHGDDVRDRHGARRLDAVVRRARRACCGSRRPGSANLLRGIEKG
jgi:hypothetical protein